MSDKKKYYLRGLSIGMIFTCIVLMIVFKNNPAGVTDKQFAEEAEKRGYVLKQDEAKPTTSINLDELKKTPEPTPTVLPSAEPTSTNSTAPSPTNSPNPTASPTTEPAPTNTPEPTATSSPTPTATSVPTSTVTPMPTPGPETTEMTVATIVIKNKMTSEMVTKLLYEAKIITDTKSFNQFIYDNYAANSLMPGTYEVNNKMSYKDLLYILTRGTIRAQ